MLIKSEKCYFKRNGKYILMHRESTNSYTAKFVIEKERMYVENANRATSDRYITENNLESIPKNPIIAFFSKI